MGLGVSGGILGLVAIAAAVWWVRKKHKMEEDVSWAVPSYS